MAISDAMVWRIRAGGNIANGGGYDSTVAGAGTDYSDQDAAQISITDGATTGAVATLTSAAALFTSAMVGNVIRIASGTNFTPGYYVVTTFTNSTTVVLDRACATGVGTGGTGSLGGAFAHFGNFANGGQGSGIFVTAAITSPLSNGHTIMIRGSGSLDPSSSDYTWANYWNMPDNGSAVKHVTLTGYNGRPRISWTGLLMFTTLRWVVNHCSFFQTSTNFSTYGVFGYASLLGQSSANDCIFDQNGQDATQWIVGAGGQANMPNGFSNNEIRNTGSTTVGTKPALGTSHVSGLIIGNYIHGVRGPAIELHGREAVVINNIIANNQSDGILESFDDGTLYVDTIIGNTIYGNLGHGVNVATNGISGMSFMNNIVANHTGSGKYGINCADSLATNTAIRRYIFDYNCWYGNTNNFNNWAAQTHDITTDPGFVNAGAFDWSIGSNAKGIGFPGLIPATTSTSHTDLGAVQAVAGSGGLSAVGAAG